MFISLAGHIKDLRPIPAIDRNLFIYLSITELRYVLFSPEPTVRRSITLTDEQEEGNALVFSANEKVPVTHYFMYI